MSTPLCHLDPAMMRTQLPAAAMVCSSYKHGGAVEVQKHGPCLQHVPIRFSVVGFAAPEKAFSAEPDMGAPDKVAAATSIAYWKSTTLRNHPAVAA